MIHGSKRVDFPDAEALDTTGIVLRCRVAGKTVNVPPLRILPGSDVRHPGDRGHLVLPLDLAEELGLVPPPRG
jgi:hypothetical protein